LKTDLKAFWRVIGRCGIAPVIISSLRTICPARGPRFQSKTRSKTLV
jgi:hypothetical protein